MLRNRKLLLILLGCFSITVFFVILFFAIKKESVLSPDNITTSAGRSSNPSPTDILLPTPPIQYVIPQKLHVFQSFNNCGPAAFSMTLSYYGINKTQDELGNEIRPYQIPGGNNDDKSVTLVELAEKSREYNLIPYHRPMGNPEILKQFISNNIPVITRTWLKPNEDIGHYRVVRGYDSINFIQDDSLQGKNLTYAYSEFDEIWKKFNYEFLVLIPEDKKELAEKILGVNVDEKTAWNNAVIFSEEELNKNPDDIYTRFNLSVALSNSGNHQNAVEEFEKVESSLPFRTLWYQIEPIESYLELGNYERVFSITERILNNQNRAFSELYILRGKSYQKQGDLNSARIEFEKAILYNKNLKPAKDALLELDAMLKI